MSDKENFESDYYASRSFDEQHLRKVRSHYLKFFNGRRFLVELGCGRGEFLKDSTEIVDRALGIDIEPAMAEAARERGLEVHEGDALSYLRETADRPDAVFAAHLVEHFSVDDTFELLRAAANIMEPGGVVVLVTPNPYCLAVMLSDFWSDPTHVRPYTTALLEFLVKQAGFVVIESGANPLDVPGPPPELIVPETMEGWGPLETHPLPDLPEYKGSISRRVDERLEFLLQRTNDINQTFAAVTEAIQRRVDELRHQTHLATIGVNNALKYLYGPNEIYIAAERPA